MPDAFFQKKRKRSGSSAAADRPGPSRSRGGQSSSSARSGGRRDGGSSRRGRNDSDEDSDDDDGGADAGFEDGDTRHRYDVDVTAEDELAESETPAEARVRMAKMYLQGLKTDDLDPEDADAAQIDAANVASRLQKDVSERSGKLHVFVASRLQPPPSDGSRSLLLRGGHRGTLTAAVASNNGRWVYTAAKDGNVFRWRMSDGRIDCLLPRAGSSVMSARATTNGVSGPADESDDNDDDQAAQATSASVMPKDSEMTPLRSRSSGSSRRKARRQARELAITSSKGKDKASDGRRLHDVVELDADEGHTGELWSLSLSQDGKFLATGGADRRIGIWSCPTASEGSSNESPSWVKALAGHKDGISGLRFRVGSHELYSASLDRTLKLFDVDQLSYIETLFGHQESILSLDALRSELAVSVGGRDRSARWWKIRDESQLVFRGGAKNKMRDVMEGGDLLDAEGGQRKVKGDRGGAIVEGSLEAVAMIDDSHFLTGGDSGAISLWSLGKKKPIFTRAVTHGFDRTTSSDGQETLVPRWITSLAALPYGDVFASGSWDGSIRLWALDRQLRSFKPLFNVAAPGFVNSVQLLQPPRSTLKEPCVRPELYRFRVKTGAREVNGHVNGQVNGHGGDINGAVSASAATEDASIRGRKEMVAPILIAALGQEPRMGRWIKDKKVQSAGLVVPLSF